MTNEEKIRGEAAVLGAEVLRFAVDPSDDCYVVHLRLNTSNFGPTTIRLDIDPHDDTKHWNVVAQFWYNVAMAMKVYI